MNDMPSQALAQLVERRASTFTAFRNGYGLREDYLKMIYGLRANTVLEKAGFKREILFLCISLKP